MAKQQLLAVYDFCFLLTDTFQSPARARQGHTKDTITVLQIMDVTANSETRGLFCRTLLGLRGGHT